MSKPSKWILILALAIVLLSAVCLGLEKYLDNNTPLSVAILGAGVFTVAGCIILTESSGKPWISDPGAVRTTIALSLVVEYIVLIGIVSTFISGPKELPGITQTMISSFTTIVGVVIAFFFGASAYVQGQERKGPQSQIPADHNDPVRNS
jgi:hypothetical protein